MATPSTKVEIAFNAGYSTPIASRIWTDVSAFVEAGTLINITRGRADENAQVQPSTLNVTFNNTDGRFTPEKTGGAYYPNVKKGRPIRVTVTYNAVSYVRFVGYISEWPVVWPDSTDSVSTVTVVAQSRMARLGTGGELSTVASTAILNTSPDAYWPMSDPVGSTRAFDASGHLRDLLPTGGPPPTFGITTAPGSDESSAAAFITGNYMSPPNPGFSAINGIAIAFASTTPGGITPTTLMVWGNDFLTLSIGAGTLAVSGVSLGSGFNDGKQHIVAIRYTGPTTADVYVDAVLTVSGATLNGSGTNPAVYIGGGPAPFVDFIGTIADAAVWLTAPAASDLGDISVALGSGYSGDLAGARITRYARLAGIEAADMDINTGVAVIGTIESSGATPLTLSQKVAETDNGVLFDAKDGKLTFRQRTDRYNKASSFTLDGATHEIQGDLLPVLNDLFLANDVTATGINTQARAFDQTSINDYGYYRPTLDLATESTADVLASAQWRVGLNKQPSTRYPTVSVDVVNLSTSQAAVVMSADISTRFGLSGLPVQAPASTADFFAEGYVEAIGSATHTLTFNTSPAAGYAGSNGVWQLDVNNIDGPYILAL